MPTARSQRRGDLLDQLSRQMTLPDSQARTIVEAIDPRRDMLDS